MVTDNTPAPNAEKTHIVGELEAEAKAPLERRFKLPQTHVHWLSKCLDKYGENYEVSTCYCLLMNSQITIMQLIVKYLIIRRSVYLIKAGHALNFLF